MPWPHTWPNWDTTPSHKSPAPSHTSPPTAPQPHYKSCIEEITGCRSSTVGRIRSGPVGSVT